eukprot:4100750-Pleurochrysis_carterae.AAC.4
MAATAKQGIQFGMKNRHQRRSAPWPECSKYVFSELAVSPYPDMDSCHQSVATSLSSVALFSALTIVLIEVAGRFASAVLGRVPTGHLE